MTVTAGTVIVNGKVAGAAAAAEGRGAAAAGGKGGGSWRSRISASRSAIAGGAAFSAFFGVLDLWAARQHNAETSADAAILIKQAANNLQAVQQAYGVQSQEYHNAFLKASEWARRLVLRRAASLARCSAVLSALPSVPSAQ